jgi:hypothetical protein
VIHLSDEVAEALVQLLLALGDRVDADAPVEDELYYHSEHRALCGQVEAAVDMIRRKLAVKGNGECGG